MINIGKPILSFIISKKRNEKPDPFGPYPTQKLGFKSFCSGSLEVIKYSSKISLSASHKYPILIHYLSNFLLYPAIIGFTTLSPNNMSDQPLLSIIGSYYY